MFAGMIALHLDERLRQCGCPCQCGLDQGPRGVLSGPAVMVATAVPRPELPRGPSSHFRFPVPRQRLPGSVNRCPDDVKSAHRPGGVRPVFHQHHDVGGDERGEGRGERRQPPECQGPREAPGTEPDRQTEPGGLLRAGRRGLAASGPEEVATRGCSEAFRAARTRRGSSIA